MNLSLWVGYLAAETVWVFKRFVPTRLALIQAKPRISRIEYRRLRWRRAIMEFADLIELGYPVQAKRRAHLALRLWPEHPQSHAVMGIAYQEQCHHEEALRCFDQALARPSLGAEGAWELRGLKAFLAGEVATLAIHSCCVLRAEGLTEEEHRDWTTHIIEWFNIALQADAFHVDVILNDPVLPLDLRGVLKAKRESVADLSWAVQP